MSAPTKKLVAVQPTTPRIDEDTRYVYPRYLLFFENEVWRYDPSQPERSQFTLVVEWAVPGETTWTAVDNKWRPEPR